MLAFVFDVISMGLGIQQSSLSAVSSAAAAVASFNIIAAPCMVGAAGDVACGASLVGLAAMCRRARWW